MITQHKSDRDDEPAPGLDEETVAAVDEDEDEFSDDNAELSDDVGYDDLSGADEDEKGSEEADFPMTAEARNARSLEIRRAIEERLEKRQMSAYLDYLDEDD